MFKHLRGNNFGGHFKNVQNYIQGIDDVGNAYTAFTPLALYETAPAIENLCETFNKAIEDGKVDPLILIPVFIHDFLCIHPFRDGNGRTSRGFLNEELMRFGFPPMYIKIERKDEYRAALAQIDHKGDYTMLSEFMMKNLISSHVELSIR